MKLSETGARIVNVSSTTATHVWGILTSITARAKAALNKITADMSKTLGPARHHGQCDHPRHDPDARNSADYMEVLKKQHGWGEDPEENERRHTKEIFPQSVPRLGKLRDTATLTTFSCQPACGIHQRWRTCASTVASRSSCEHKHDRQQIPGSRQLRGPVADRPRHCACLRRGATVYVAGRTSASGGRRRAAEAELPGTIDLSSWTRSPRPADAECS